MAAIKDRFDTVANLVEGHGGAFKVLVNDIVIFDNQGKCGSFPEHTDILRRISEFTSSPVGNTSTRGRAEARTEMISPASRVSNNSQSASCSCCGGEQDTIQCASVPGKGKRLQVEFMYLDWDQCAQCLGARVSLHAAIQDVARVLSPTGVAVTPTKVHIQTEEKARQLGFLISPTIRINGQDIQPDIKERLCDNCSYFCGEDIYCRVWEYEGKEYDSPPKGMLIDAMLRAVYGSERESSRTLSQIKDVPDNIKRYFAAKRNRKIKVGRKKGA